MQLIQSSLLLSALYMFRSHHQELIKLYVQPWVLSWFPAVYSWCGRVESMTIPKAAHTVYKLLMMGGNTVRNMYSADNNKENFTSCVSLDI
jgi:hypothetical protein